jgi:hypothetical protein
LKTFVIASSHCRSGHSRDARQWYPVGIPIVDVN